MVIIIHTVIYPTIQAGGNNITISNCNIIGDEDGGGYGIEVGGEYSHGNYYKSDIKIINCDIRDFDYKGIIMHSSHHCYIKNCRFFNNRCGIQTLLTTYYDNCYYYIYNYEFFNNSEKGIELGRRKTFICNCSFHDNFCGIYNYHIQSWTDDQITSCSFINNSYGCIFDPYPGYPTAYSKILGNIFRDNNINIYFTEYCFDNDIYHNNFINCIDYYAADLGNNNWDNGAEGNFWDDYTGSEGDCDGIGDEPYYIPVGNGYDSYPLMNPNSM